MRIRSGCVIGASYGIALVQSLAARTEHTVGGRRRCRAAHNKVDAVGQLEQRNERVADLALQLIVHPGAVQISVCRKCARFRDAIAAEVVDGLQRIVQLGLIIIQCCTADVLQIMIGDAAAGSIQKRREDSRNSRTTAIRSAAICRIPIIRGVCRCVPCVSISLISCILTKHPVKTGPADAAFLQ